MFYVDDGTIITMLTSPLKNVQVVRKTYKDTHGALTNLRLRLEHSKTDGIHFPGYDPNNKRKINTAPIDLGFSPFHWQLSTETFK